MKYFFKKMHFVVLFSLSILGCQEEVELKQKQQYIVFGGQYDYTLHQISDQIAVTGGYEHSDEERDILWEAGMASWATGFIRTQECAADFDANLCYTTNHFECDLANEFEPPGEEKYGTGSGVLTSLTRLSTAHHVTHGGDKPIGKYTVYFDLDQIPEDEDTASLEELWLLPNRLYSLGLIPFGKADSRAERDAWRQWDYWPERSGYTTLIGDTFDYDLSIMVPLKKSVTLPLDDLGDVDLSRIQFTGPGILFGQVPASIDSHHAPIVEQDEHYWASHTNEVPAAFYTKHNPSLMNGTFDKVKQLVGYPGYSDYLGSFNSCTSPSDTRCNEDGSGGYEHDATTYGQHCFHTSHDLKSGSSGGMVYRWKPENHLGDSSNIARGMYGMGIFNGAVGAGSWDSVVEPGVYPTTNNYVNVTTLSAQHIDDSRKDYNYYPNQLPPGESAAVSSLSERLFYQPGTSVPDGCDVANDPQCAQLEPTTPQQGGSIGIDELHVDTVSYDCQDVYAPFAQSNVRVANGFAVGLFGTPTYTIDEVVNDSNFDESIYPTLSTLGMICAPWSEAIWSDNWQDLRFFSVKRSVTTGRFDDGQWELDQGIIGANLARHLPSMWHVLKYDWRQDIDYASFFGAKEHSGNKKDFYQQQTLSSHDLIGPMPMQMCPPGYALNGVGLIYRDCSDDFDAECSAGDFVVRGVEYLVCAPAPVDKTEGVSWEEQLIYVYLDPKNPTIDIHPSVTGQNNTLPPQTAQAGVYGYNFFGTTVELEQHIGTPTSLHTNDAYGEIVCPSYSAVAGMTTNAPTSNDGDVTSKMTLALEWKCIDLPSN